VSLSPAVMGLGVGQATHMAVKEIAILSVDL